MQVSPKSGSERRVHVHAHTLTHAHSIRFSTCFNLYAFSYFLQNDLREGFLERPDPESCSLRCLAKWLEEPGPRAGQAAALACRIGQQPGASQNCAEITQLTSWSGSLLHAQEGPRWNEDTHGQQTGFPAHGWDGVTD